jgi:hypothetical protein
MNTRGSWIPLLVAQAAIIILVVAVLAGIG